MEEKQEKQIQEKIISEFNQLVEEVKEDKTKFLDLLIYIEEIEAPKCAQCRQSTSKGNWA